MKIYKNINTDNKYEIIFENDEKEIFKIHYGGADLYWTMINYRDGNKFQVAETDKMIYYQLQELFKEIENNDFPYNKTLNNNCFEWLSEAYGIPEEAHKLLITKNEDSFIIEFIRNPNNFLSSDFCPICFCLNGSRNSSIASAFSLMFLQYKSNNKIKTLNRN